MDPKEITLRLHFDRRFPEWHERSSPQVLAADGSAVLEQNVGHPGDEDPVR